MLCRGWMSLDDCDSDDDLMRLSDVQGVTEVLTEVVIDNPNLFV